MRRKKVLFCVLLMLFLMAGASGVSASARDFFAALPNTQAKAVTSKKPKILFVGNSHTYFNNMPEMFRKICNKKGIYPEIETVASSGHSLYEYAYPNASKPEEVKLSKRLKSLLKKKKWDYVILQGRRYESINNLTNMQKAIAALRPLIKKSGAQMVLYLTWPPKEGHEDYAGASAKALTPEEYLSKSYDAVYRLAQKNGAAMAPSGVAFVRAKTVLPDVELYREDKNHANITGSYLSACVIYATLFGKSPEGCTYYPSISGKSSGQCAQIGKYLQALAADVTVRGSTENHGQIKFTSQETVIKSGSKKKLQYKIVSGLKGTRVVSWKSDEPRVATVDKNGTVTAHVPGTAKITAKLSNNKKAYCAVIVSQGDMTMGAGEKYTLRLKNNIKWVSSDAGVAAVSGNKVIAKKKGTAVLTGTTAKKSKIRIKITVKDAPKELSLPKKQILLRVGHMVKLNVGTGSGTTANGFTFVSDHPDIVAVNERGVLKALRPGNARIVVKSYNGKKIICDVKSIVQAKKIALRSREKSIRLKKGGTKKLQVVFTPANTTLKTLTWESANTDVVKVSQNGTIRAVGAGTTQIAATTKDGSKLRIKLKVKVV